MHLVVELTLDDGPPRLDDQIVPALAERVESILRERWSVAPSEFTSIAGKFAGDLA
ncbi:MAG: hypothetical protein ACRDYU_09965 [Actinomycetes bacterium]